MLRAYQKAMIFETEKGIKTTITQGCKLKKVVTCNGSVYTDVYIQTLKDDSIGILSNEGIKHIDLWNIQDFE